MKSLRCLIGWHDEEDINERPYEFTARELRQLRHLHEHLTPGFRSYLRSMHDKRFIPARDVNTHFDDWLRRLANRMDLCDAMICLRCGSVRTAPGWFVRAWLEVSRSTDKYLRRYARYQATVVRVDEQQERRRARAQALLDQREPHTLALAPTSEAEGAVSVAGRHTT